MPNQAAKTVCAKMRKKSGVSQLAAFVTSTILLSLVLQTTALAAPASVAPQFAGAYALTSGQFQLYAPAVINDRLYSGGWSTAAEVGPDKLYVSYYNGIAASPPLPIQWDAAANPGYEPGLVPGYHANDPTVIAVPGTPYQFMYYTLLPNGDDEKDTERNQVGFASSYNGGLTWTNHGVIIGQYNGIDGSGAWAPSAVVVGNEIWIYYHTGSAVCNDSICQTASRKEVPPRVFRTRLSLNGWQQLGTDYTTIESRSLLIMANVDVKYSNGLFWMAGNQTMNDVSLFTSTNGRDFQPYNGTDAILFRNSAAVFPTPSLRFTSAHSFEVLFGYSSTNLLTSIDSIQQWNFNY